ncbi:unnamed protein product [Rotaria sp. Silwood1]|nr:unnamed protein product [Rotaria sp. Silwood1]CAF1570198.1 unnamed protein product [Rotaria sp. Silwood1]CAF1627570.1 unnamed protein product [Rotaria sp. Silwood1]
MSPIHVYLGLNGMNMALTEFYYTHLLQTNVSNYLISLCVSDTLAIDNELWLAEHLSTFINLRHLSLIDIKRSSFEMILNAFSSNTSLFMFSVHFPTYYRAAYTYEGVPEGIDIDGIHDPDVISGIGERYDIHSLVQTDITTTEQRTKLDVLDDALFLVCKSIS